MAVVTPIPAVAAPFVNNGGQVEAQLPVQALTAAALLVPAVSLVKTYNVRPEALTRKEPRLAFWPTFTAAGEVGVAMAAIVAVAIGLSVDCPVIGITGMAVAVGVADAHAESTSVNTSRREKKILLFIMILLAVILRHLYASRINGSLDILF